MTTRTHKESATATADSAKRRPRLRISLLATVLTAATLSGWILWPRGPELSPYDLSAVDGKPRFWATELPKYPPPPSSTWVQGLSWRWAEYERHHGAANPARYSFPASEAQPRFIIDLLTQCMEISGTRYLVAVEVRAQIEFGNTNALSGAQWVAAVEQKLRAGQLVRCYDYAKKGKFDDSLLLICERPGVVKVVPRTKLAEYQAAGLVEKGSQ